MKTILTLLLLILPNLLFSQQIADTTYNPEIKKPAYAFGKGPVVFIDEGHYNFHTKSGRYKAFANLLERNGYNVLEYKGEFEKSKLTKGKILVISNALNAINAQNWFLPTPSAFTPSEIEIVKKWVSDGGSLFLIADHMPLAGAARDLAAVFGFEFTNGFVFDSITGGTCYFNLADGTLNKSIITKGRDKSESVDRIVSFTGQGFKIPDDATSILTFNKNCTNSLPDTAWVFKPETPKFKVEGWSQGAFKKYGKGKVVAFGEAAMFTAQLAGPEKRKMGMNNEIAPQNHQLLLNIIHWLDGKLK
jgi:hypothetical protein